MVRENDTKPAGYAGLWVSISDTYDPTNWHKGLIKPGTLTKLSLAATKVKLLNIKDGPMKQPCVENGTELYRIFNLSYTRTACQMDCLINAFYRHCNCVMLMDKSIVKEEIMSKTPFCAFSKTL